MNGIEFVATLKADRKTRDVPVVFLGSNAEFDDLGWGWAPPRFSPSRSMPAACSKSSASAFGQRPRNKPALVG
jgi:CheY-like chemotaxis protein